MVEIKKCSECGQDCSYNYYYLDSSECVCADCYGKSPECEADCGEQTTYDEKCQSMIDAYLSIYRHLSKFKHSNFAEMVAMATLAEVRIDEEIGFWENQKGKRH